MTCCSHISISTTIVVHRGIPIFFVMDVDLSSLDVKALLSSVLGYGILLGAFGLKIPQIMNIINSGSVEGLSEMAFYTEVPLVTTNIVYNYLKANPFRSYGETCIILVQNLILVGLLWSHSKQKPSYVKMMTVLLVFVCVTLISLHIPQEFQYVLPLTNLPMMLMSKCPQIFENMKNKKTGQLSLVTNFLTLAGSLARVFTTIQDVGYDFALLSICLTNTVTSGILVLQIIIYMPVNASKPIKEKNVIERALECLSCASGNPERVEKVKKV